MIGDQTMTKGFGMHVPECLPNVPAPKAVLNGEKVLNELLTATDIAIKFSESLKNVHDPAMRAVLQDTFLSGVVAGSRIYGRGAEWGADLCGKGMAHGIDLCALGADSMLPMNKPSGG